MIRFYLFLLAVFVITGCITLQVSNESAMQDGSGTITEAILLDEKLENGLDVNLP